MTTPAIARSKPIIAMTPEELRYTWAFAENETRRCAENSPTMDRWEARRQQAEAELARRRA